MTDDSRSIRKDSIGVSWYDPSAEPAAPLTTTQRLLLPIDDSDDSDLSDRVLRLGGRLLKPHGAVGRGVVLHVLASPGDSSRREREVVTARNRLDDRIRDLGPQPFQLRSFVNVGGNPAEEILSTVRATDSRMIVMASHGRSGLERVVRGSVAEEVLRTAHVPLLLCNPHELRIGDDAPFLRILVPIDGSQGSAAILPLVEELAQMHGSEVVLLCVEPKALEQGTQRYGQVTGFLNVYARHLSERGVAKITLRSGIGDPAEQILHGIEETRADLVAMTTHGRSGFSRLRFGSVAEEVLRKCVIPLLVLREPSPS